MSPAEKMHRAWELSQAVRSAAEAGLRQQFPNASEREIRQRLGRLILGEELYLKAYGDDEPA